MKKQLIRAAAATVLGLSLTAGFASADTITKTGYDSSNKVTTSNNWQTSKTNNNKASVSNWNGQLAASGDAQSSKNTEGGDSTSGAAGNANGTSTSVSYSNGGGAAAAVAPVSMGSSDGATIDTTGADSTNTVKTTNNYQSSVTNNNSVKVQNESLQGAFSGNATTSKNTQGGSASTGSVSNTNTTTTSVDFSN